MPARRLFLARGVPQGSRAEHVALPAAEMPPAKDSRSALRILTNDQAYFLFSNPIPIARV